MSAKFSYCSRRTVLVPAATAALLVGAAVAGCGSTTSSAASGNLPAAPGSGSQGSPAGGSPAGGSPTAGPQAPPSSPAPQANGSFPYKPGGVTYSGDEGGVYTFSIPAGRYSENTQASYDPANDPDGSGQCMFGGGLDYLSGSGWSVPIGVTVPISAQDPINGPVTVATYGAGDYRLRIYPTATCSWTFTLLPHSS